jgi:quinol monooxygenase YgiN
MPLIPPMTIHVVARAVARPGCREALQRALLAVIPPTRAEPGCIRYQLAQSTADEDEFVMLEEWRGEAELRVHMQTAHVQRLLAEATALLAAPPDIRSYRIVD